MGLYDSVCILFLAPFHQPMTVINQIQQSKRAARLREPLPLGPSLEKRMAVRRYRNE
jgi:hypothetical protein